MFKKTEIKKITELKKNDIILTVDSDQNESLEIVKCVDKNVWLESVSTGHENKESQEDFYEYHKVYLINRDNLK